MFLLFWYCPLEDNANINSNSNSVCFVKITSSTPKVELHMRFTFTNDQTSIK